MTSKTYILETKQYYIADEKIFCSLSPFSKLDVPIPQLNAGNCRLEYLLFQRYKFLKKSCSLRLYKSMVKAIATLFDFCIMVNANQPKIYVSGCHCGAVRFKVVVEKYQADECNCSICQKKGFLHLIVPHNKFTLLKGEEVLTTYTFNTAVAKHIALRASKK